MYTPEIHSFTILYIIMTMAKAGEKPDTETWLRWWQTLHWDLRLGESLHLYSEKTLYWGLLMLMKTLEWDLLMLVKHLFSAVENPYTATYTWWLELNTDFCWWRT